MHEDAGRFSIVRAGGVAAPPPEPAPKRRERARKQKAARDACMIELEIDGVAMRVDRGVPGRWRR